MSIPPTPPITTTTTSAAAAEDDSDLAAGGPGSKAMMEYFRKRCKSGGVSTNDPGDSQSVCEVSSSTDTDCRPEPMMLNVHKDYGYYHTVSSSDARVLRAALAKERVPIFRRSESKARRSMGGASVRVPKDRRTAGETSQTDGQSFSVTRSDSKSFRDIFLRRRNRSDRSEPNPDITGEGKPKTGGVRIRNFLVSFRSRPRAVSVSYAPVDNATTSSATMATSTPAASVQTVGKKKKFKVSPATLLPGLKRPDPPPRVGPEDFVEMYCRSRTTSDPRSDAILKARVAASLQKVITTLLMM